MGQVKKPAVAKPRRAARPRIARNARGAHAAEIFARLKRAYPDAHTELDHETPLQLLMATILSAQCTDKRVNMVTPLLFRTYPTAQSLADAEQEKLEEIIRSTGFFHNKAKSLIGLGKALVERHGGEVPDSMEALVKLPGVGRKTANVILGNAFGKNEGVVVDTHVGRLSLRLGLNEGDRSGESRAGSDAPLPARRVGDVVARANLSRSASLLRAIAQLRGVRAQRHLPVEYCLDYHSKAETRN